MGAAAAWDVEVVRMRCVDVVPMRMSWEDRV